MNSTHDSPSPAARRRRGEAGSAYMIVLLALVVLTILALSLAFVTQTEVQIGGNERVTNRVFYASEAGLGAATAGLLTNHKFDAHTYTFTEPGTVAGLSLTETVDVSPVLPIQDSPCNLCEINDIGTYNEKSFRKVNHAVTATSTRTAGGQKTITLMIELQPWQMPPEALLPLDDPTQLAKIKF